MICLSMGYPDFENERKLIDRSRFHQEPITPLTDRETFRKIQGEVEKVYIHEDIQRYIVSLVSATRDHELLELGASPRATMDLAAMARSLAGRKRLCNSQRREQSVWRRDYPPPGCKRKGAPAGSQKGRNSGRNQREDRFLRQEKAGREEAKIQTSGCGDREGVVAGTQNIL